MTVASVALAAGGKAGVSQMLADMGREFRVALVLSGRIRLPGHERAAAPVLAVSHNG